MIVSRTASGYGLRKSVDRFGSGIALLAVILAIIPLGAMMAYVVIQGGSSLDLAFFTNGPRATGETGGGMEPFIIGTLEIIFFSSLIGLPIGLMSGIFLSRAYNTAFSQAVRFFTDVIAGTPSIIAGVVAYALIVIPLGHFSILAGAVALGILMFPTVTRATEEAIRLVPASVREAGLALGLPEWKTMFRIILPTAATGIVTAIMLGIARVAGETAPLLFTVFTFDTVQLSPLKPVGALPVQIWTDALQPYADLQRQAWAGAFVLFAIILILNLTARFLTRRLTARTGQG